MKELSIEVDAETLLMQKRDIEELYIYLDFHKKQITLFADDEYRIKFNFIKMFKKYSNYKSEADFWKNIIDVKIRKSDPDLPEHYVVTYELKD